MAYEINGFPDAAFASYRQAEALDREDARWPYFQSLLLADRGQHQVGVAALDRAIAIDASYGPAWLRRGIWLLDPGRGSGALLGQAAPDGAGHAESPSRTSGR